MPSNELSLNEKLLPFSLWKVALTFFMPDSVSFVIIGKASLG